DVWLPENGEALCPLVEEVLANTPGVAKFSRVRTYPLLDLTDMADKVREAWGSQLKGKTFCVRVRRRGEQTFSSMEAERSIGAALLAAGDTGKVDLRNPDVTVALEVQGDEFHLVEEAR